MGLGKIVNALGEIESIGSEYPLITLDLSGDFGNVGLLTKGVSGSA